MRLRVVLALLAGLLLCAQTPMLPGFPPGTFQNRAALDAAPAAGGCSEATTFLARTSGLSGTETAAYTAMICGMVTDGVWSKLDALYIFATNTTTTANLNLKSTNFPITLTSGTNNPTFTVDQGYTAAGGGHKILDTSLIPDAGGLNYTLNSASVGGYVLNNRTSNANDALIGISNGQVAQLTLLNGGATQSDLNESSFPTTANTTSQGSWFLTRNAASGAGALILYRNGSSFGSYTAASVAIPPTCSFFILGRAQNAGCTVATISTDQVAAAWIGSGFNATEVANFSSRLNAYMTALGINVY